MLTILFESFINIDTLEHLNLSMKSALEPKKKLRYKILIKILLKYSDLCVQHSPV